MDDYASLHADVAALIAARGPVTRSAVAKVLDRHPSPETPPNVPPASSDVFNNAVFDPSVFG